MTEKCKDRVRAAYKSTMEDIITLWEQYKRDPEKEHPDLGNWDEYGLCFDYVPRGTFKDQRRGFFRYQISTGGPGEEFRFYTDETKELVSIEFWFLDWFDGAKVSVTGKAFETWMEIWESFKEMGLLDLRIKEAG